MEEFFGEIFELIREEQVIDLGNKKIMVLETPHIPHGWESCLFYEITNKILFSSDFGSQPGINSPLTEIDITHKMSNFLKETGYMPEGEKLENVILKSKDMEIDFLATMHGSTIKSNQINMFFKALISRLN